jgi:outer membrane lipoprotein-sorting protein
MVRSNSAFTDPSWLVPLLYRADWTRLCLSADLAARVESIRRVTISPGRDFWRPVTDAGPDGKDYPDDLDAADDLDDADDLLPGSRDGVSRLLIAPGGRFRIEYISSGPSRCLAVCDGETSWRIYADEVRRSHLRGLDSELIELLDPSWLIGRYDLDLTGAAEAAGRPACRVVATPRQVAFGPGHYRYCRFDRVDVLVDTELGILLRREAFADGKSVELTEVRSLTLDPVEAGDPAQFRPPPGLPKRDDWPGPEPLFDTSGPGWSVVKTGARAVGAALTFAVRRAGGQPAPAAAAPPVPEPGEPPADGQPAPLSDDLVNLLHRTGLPPQRFAAGVRKWTDGELVFRGLAELRATALTWPLSGILGPDALWEAITERQHRSSRITFQTARLRVAMPGKYRIDHLAGDWKERVSACDGARHWTVYPNRVVSEPAKPLSMDWARLADPAWLLVSTWQLTAGAAEHVGGRRGWRIWAEARPERGGVTEAGMFGRAIVTVDAELGIVLRLAFLVDDRPAICLELHDLTIPAADDTGDFRVRVPPGTRLVEASGPLAQLDIPAPLRAAWTVGKTGLAGASTVAGWLQDRLGKPADRAESESARDDDQHDR